jgi:hypothetical protein
MVLLDADTAGCVSVWLNNNGRLGAWRRTVIATSYRCSPIRKRPTTTADSATLPT